MTSSELADRPWRVNTLVIGGGLLGCAVAFYLASAGTSVMVAERGQINRQASGQNAGSLHFQLEYRMIENGIERARKAAEAMPLHLDAQQAWSELEYVLGTPLGIAQTGGLMVAEKPEDVARLEAKVELERQSGLAVELLDRSDLDRMAPYLSNAVIAAAFCRREGKADPRRCTLAFAHAAEQRGASVRSRLGVTAINRLAGRWEVAFDDGTNCVADTVVIAAGAWSGKIAELVGARLPVEAIGLMMSVTAPTSPLVGHLVQHAGRRLSMKQNEFGNVIIGGGWPADLVRNHAGAVELDYGSKPLLASIVGNLRTASTVVNAVTDLPVLRIWTGMTSQTPDQLPLIGDVPDSPGCYVATGGSAFTLGPTYARILADRILGRPAKFDISAYSPSRDESSMHVQARPS